MVGLDLSKAMIAGRPDLDRMPDEVLERQRHVTAMDERPLLSATTEHGPRLRADVDQSCCDATPATTTVLLQTMSRPGEGAPAPALVRAQLDRLRGQPQEV